MNENSTSKMLAINDWLKTAAQKLQKADIKSPRLDAELILTHVLKTERTSLHAHPEQYLTAAQAQKAEELLSKRLKRVPIAYLLGHKEFYGRNFLVSPDTLIPRPESETIIEQLKELPEITDCKTLVDIGTGSGCLGITAKLELPRLEVTLADISPAALEMASQNAKNLNADVKITASDLLSEIHSHPDIIIANLPYVNPDWKRSPETSYEPSLALFAEDNGLKLIKKLIDQAANETRKNACLILEADPTQFKDIISYANKNSFSERKAIDYTLVLQKD